MINWNDYRNFSESEFRCRCGLCRRADMDPTFMRLVQEIRDEFGNPMRVTSGYRCPLYNDIVSTTGKTGPHTTGCAVDIGISGPDAHRLTAILFRRNLYGLGFKQKGPHRSRFIHFDNLINLVRPRIWTY